MRNRFGLTFLLLLSSTIYAQQPERPTQNETPPQTIKIETGIVLIDAQVLSKKTGLPIGALDREDFEVYEDGIKQAISYFGRDDLPLSAVLLVDASPSVQPLIKQLQSGARKTLETLRAQDEVALAAFSRDAAVVENFTTDHDLIIDGMSKLVEKEFRKTLKSGTFLKKGLFKAAELCKQRTNQASRPVIIVLTDNYSLPFGPSESQITRLLYETGAVVCGLVIREKAGKITGMIPSVYSFTGSSGSIFSYAGKTGGEVVIHEEGDISAKLVELIENLRSRYSIGYISSNSEPDGGFRKVKLKMSPVSSAPEKDTVIKAREGYYAEKRAKKRS